MSAKTLTIRLEDKPELSKKLDRIMKGTNCKTYQSLVERIINEYEQQDKLIHGLRDKIITLQNEVDEKNGILQDVKRFISIPERLRLMEQPEKKKKGVKSLANDLFN
jgi:hypothetical protein